MSKVKFCGVLENITYEELCDFLKEVLDPGQINSKVRLFGEEISYSDEQLELYARTENNSVLKNKSRSKDNFLLEGQFFGSLLEQKNYFQRWLNIFNSRSIPYSFEYYEEDSEGNWVSDSEEVRHPNYGRN